MEHTYPLPLETASGEGHNAVTRITPSDLTETTAATAQTLTVAVKDQSIKLVGFRQAKPLSDKSDSAFDDISLKVGDGGDDDRFLAATQVGSSQTAKKGNGTDTTHFFAGADTLDIVLTPEAGKALADVDDGDLELLWEVREG